MQTNKGSEATNQTGNNEVLATDTNAINTNAPVTPVTPLLDSEAPSEDFEETNPETNPPAQFIGKEKALARKEEQKARMADLESRAQQPLPAATGNPQASVADPMGMQVKPRYVLVQNRSSNFLIIPDLKTSDEDMGETMYPGDVVCLTDFYSPQQINRSRGLIYAATKMKGLDGNCALVPLANEEQGADFIPPQKKEYPPGTQFEDMAPNDFDLRFQELEEKELKREERLKRKSLGMRKSSKHGSVNNV